MSDVDQEIVTIQSQDQYGSMEKALAGNFELSISAVIKNRGSEPTVTKLLFGWRSYFIASSLASSLLF